MSLDALGIGHPERASTSTPRWTGTSAEEHQIPCTEVKRSFPGQVQDGLKESGSEQTQARLHELKEQKRARITPQQSEQRENSVQFQAPVGNGNHLTSMTRGKRSMGRTHPRVFSGHKENAGGFVDVVLSPNGARQAVDQAAPHSNGPAREDECLSHVTCTDAAEALVTMKLA